MSHFSPSNGCREVHVSACLINGRCAVHVQRRLFTSGTRVAKPRTYCTPFLSPRVLFLHLPNTPERRYRCCLSSNPANTRQHVATPGITQKVVSASEALRPLLRGQFSAPFADPCRGRCAGLGVEEWGHRSAVWGLLRYKSRFGELGVHPQSGGIQKGTTSILCVQWQPKGTYLTAGSVYNPGATLAMLVSVQRAPPLTNKHDKLVPGRQKNMKLRCVPVTLLRLSAVRSSSVVTRKERC